MKKNRLYIIVSILIIILIFCGYAWREYHRRPAALNELNADVSATAGNLLIDYQTSEENANKKYLGKVIDVTGEIADINIEQDTVANIQLGKKESLAHVSCSMSSDAIQETKKLSEGKSVTIRGVCTGYLMDVELNRCVIIK